MTVVLDVERFRKVQALARDGATAGERVLASFADLAAPNLRKVHG